MLILILMHSSAHLIFLRKLVKKLRFQSYISNNLGVQCVVEVFLFLLGKCKMNGNDNLRDALSAKPKRVGYAIF